MLVGHGKEKSQAVKNLEAFLGSDSESFVSWYVFLNSYQSRCIFFVAV